MSTTWTTRRQARGTRSPRIYPLDQLVRAMGLHPHDPHLTSHLAQSLHLDRSWVRRARQDGPMLTAEQADSWAARAGLHPDIVWDNWSELDDPQPLPGEDDPPIDDVEPISPDRLAALRNRTRLARAS